MYIVVVGCGRVGSQLASFLAEEGHDVVVIDRDKTAFRRLGGAFNGLALEGVGFDPDVLKEAGVEKADALAAVTNLDNTNMMIAEIATKIFEVPCAVARLYNPEREASYHKLGLDYVCGTTLVAEKMLEKIIETPIKRVFIETDLEIVKFKAGTKIVGRKVSDIEQGGEVRVTAIIRSNSSLIPSQATIIEEGDILAIATKQSFLPELQKLAQE